jgi:hypothetical protein
LDASTGRGGLRKLVEGGVLFVQLEPLTAILGVLPLASGRIGFEIVERRVCGVVT